MGETNLKEALKEKVKLNIGIIGCGNAGNQLVEAAYAAGYENVFCINSSEKDMDDSIVNQKINCFLVGNAGQGAGMKRDVAKDLFKVNYEQLFSNSRFKTICEESDIIFVGTSCSGGTGSGVSPIITKGIKQLFPGKIVIFYGILPRLSASDVELSNSSSCVSEIEDLNKKGMQIPYMLADLEFYHDTSNEVAYPQIIKKMVSDINVIAGKYLNYSKYRMIDENDTRVIISAAGYMSIYRVDGITQQMIDRESVQSMIIKQIKRSPAVDIARDGLVEQMAVISNFPEDMVDASKSGDYSEITNYIGRPLSIFENYAIVPGGTGQLIAIFSGQSYPVGHMNQISDIITEGMTSRQKKLENRKSYDSSMSGVHKFLQNSGSIGADLLGKTQNAGEEEKTGILKNLFDD